jgi:methyl-accepting chemotaxis protein
MNSKKNNSSIKIHFINSLQARLMVIVLLIAILPIIILQTFSWIQTSNSIHEQINGRFSQLAADETQFMTNWAHERLQDVNTLANLETIQKFDGDNARNLLTKYKDLWGEFENLSLINDKGITEINTDKKIIDAHERQYFIDSIGGNLIVSDPLVSKGSGHIIVMNAAPVMSSGKVAGVLVGGVPVSDITDLLGKLDLGKTGEAYIITKDGLMVTMPKYEDILKATGSIKDTAILQYKVDTFASQQILAGKSGTAEYTNYVGQKVIGSYTWIPSLRWGLIIEQNLDELLTPLNNLFIFSAVTDLIFILIIILIIYFVTRSIARPIRNLAVVADQLAEGKIKHQIDNHRNDEVGILASSFRKIISYQTQMAETARQIASGNLAVNVTPLSEQDELGIAFGQMTQRLSEAVHKIAENANTLGKASQLLAASATETGQATSQISTTIQQIAIGTSRQTESISQTAASVDQMSRVIDGVAKGAQDQSSAVIRVAEITSQITTAIQQVSSNAQAGAVGSEKAAEVAHGGVQIVTETIHGMETIKTKVALSSQKVREMGDRSGQIGTIVETIEDIASQTNLLALNAAIEAARAGEHGKGFAVVADEVRKLAEKSAAATKEIASLIKGIQQTVTDAVVAMQEGSVEVEKGVVQANQAGQALQDILKAAEEVSRQVAGIATAARQIDVMSNDLVASADSVSAVVEENSAATEEMSASSHELTTSIENIASVSEENSAAVEEVSASAEEMSTQVEQVSSYAKTLAGMAEMLQLVVDQFKL